MKMKGGILMKKQITTAILLAALLTLSACGSAPDGQTESSPPTQTAAESTTEIRTTRQPQPETTSEALTETTAPPVSEAETTQAVPEESTEAVSIPQTKSEIIDKYNSAVSALANRRASFEKTRTTEEKDFKASPLLNTFKPLVLKFMGIGKQETYSVTKSTEHYERYLLPASLTDADVTNAKCVPNPKGGYTITLDIRPGSSHIDGGNDSKRDAPLDRTGIAVGEGDRGEWDHKTAQNAYAAVEERVPDAVIDESYHDAVVKAKIDEDGNLKELDVGFNLKYALDKVFGSNGSADARTDIKYTNFR